ncbi:MAG TPA: hypothetical protein VGK77_28625 [Candidatus Binatia bacterium]
MPESLAGALEDLGHEVDSVNNLKLKGIDNGTLYGKIAVDYELCFTRDAGFAHNVRQTRDPSQVKVLRVVVPQQRVESCRSYLLLLTLFKTRIGHATPAGTIGRSSASLFLDKSFWEGNSA